MKYRIATRKHGFVIQQSQEGKESWRTAERTGLYQQRSSALSRIRQLKHESIGSQDDLGSKIMSSKLFCGGVL